MSDVKVRIEGLDELVRKCNDAKLMGDPLRDFFGRAAITVQNEARKKAPVDTGRLRASIGYEVDSAEMPMWAKVGTNVFYAPSQEFGTGRMSDGLQGGKTGHWPPGAALDVWASRHGYESGKQVAKIIGKRGGLRPKRYLRGALEASVAAIQGFVDRLGKEIEERWGR